MPRQFEKPDVAGGPFRLGEWLVEPSLNRLSRDDTTIQLELKVMDVLVCLAERAGEVVTRFEIIDRVWATEFIADNTLTHAINEIRTALGDDARNPSFIETIHRRGYRLMVPITPEERPSGTVAQFPSRARPNSDEDLSPYPGLAAFTEVDAEFFFGREAEVVQLWRKITSRRLLSVIGPSGVGKSSFLRAGVIAAKPHGWGVLVCQPGDAPFAALARALLPEFRDDPEALSKATEFEANATSLFTRWRERHDRALLIVDQFEELFTLNTPDVQARYASLIGSLAREADVHVVLAMRDDFLYRCHALHGLQPIFDALTPLTQPEPAALRRAIVEPARRLGFAFEDDELPTEMVAEIADERGALPMLAFAVARLWEKRDRDRQLLTRQAYQDIGGVAGALARHAEATVNTIGHERLPIVREIFRNLVTAEGTRAVREWDELLSIFDPVHRRAGINPAPTNAVKAVGEGFIPSRAAAEEVLRQLIDARLLTSYEVREEDREPTRSVEIIHESLLTNWPRLVRWRTQDADAAQLRDQLRQASKTWNEQGRRDDTLWTGTAYREFASWRERYPGRLSELEEAFAGAMTLLATRRRRRRRMAVTAFCVTLLGIASVVGVLWQRSVRETRRAESSVLLSQAQVHLDSYPSAALAYAAASLEMADSGDARRLALEALWMGPTAFVVNEVPSWNIAFTPDGRWLAQTTDLPDFRVHLIGADGSDRLLEDVHNDWVDLDVGPTSRVFATSPSRRGRSEPWVLWTIPDGKIIARVSHELRETYRRVFHDLRRRRFVLVGSDNDGLTLDVVNFENGVARLGTLPIDPDSLICPQAPEGEWTAAFDGRHLNVIAFGDDQISVSQEISIPDGRVREIECDPLSRFVALRLDDGEIQIWNLDGSVAPAMIQGPPATSEIRFTGDGSMLEAVAGGKERASSWIWSIGEAHPTFERRTDLGVPSGSSGWTINTVGRQVVSVFNPDSKIRMWRLDAPFDSAPVILGRGESGEARRVVAHPNGKWIASSFTNRLTVWPVSHDYPIVIDRYTERMMNLVFGPEGEWLATSAVNGTGTVRVFDLTGSSAEPARVLHEAGTYAYGLAATPDGGQILLARFVGVDLLSLESDTVRPLPGAELGMVSGGVVISRDGRLGSANSREEESSKYVISVWDLDSGDEIQRIHLDHAAALIVRVGNDGDVLYARIPTTDRTDAGSEGLVRWDSDSGEHQMLLEQTVFKGEASADGRRAILLQADPAGGYFAHGRALSFDLESLSSRTLDSHGDLVTAVATNSEGTLAVTGDRDGVIRVGSLAGGEPHLLLGLTSEIWDLAVDPRGRWIASASEGQIRLSPMPDLSKPPLHTLPRKELIAKLKTLTNLRVVRDEGSPTGWKLTHDPFPGWETVPTW